VLLPRKHLQLAQNTTAVLFSAAQPASAATHQLHHKKVGMYFIHNTLKQQQQGCIAGKVLQLQSMLCILPFRNRSNSVFPAAAV
jgi:hypothetical protein